MWLEDEKAALAIQSGNATAARGHLDRSLELARAYGGEHRLAHADIGIRRVQLAVLEGADLSATVRLTRACALDGLVAYLSAWTC
ncbi:MAG: hypothetical protein ACRDQ2_18965 [Gaiellales bacterium]